MTLQSWTETFAGPQLQPHRSALSCVRARLALCALVLSLVCGLSSLAYADASADAEALITRGIDLRRQGKDAEALEAFRQAAETHSTPRALAQMGLAEQALGHWVAAEAHLKLALEHPNNPWVSRNRDTLTRSLAAVGERLGSIELSCDVAGANVSVNGTPAGTTPLSEPLRVVSGSVVVEVIAEGYHPMTRTLQVNAGSLARENVTLVPLRVTPVTPVPTTPITPVNPSETACEVGQVRVDNHCCWPGQIWNATRQHCAGAPQCPDGLVASGLACTNAPTQAGTVREHVTIRTDVVPGDQPTPGARVEAAEATTRVAEGGEISLHIGYGGFFRRDAGLFLTQGEGSEKAFSLGPVGQFAVGYRPIRWFSFGAQLIASLQEGNADYWDLQGGDGRLLALSTGVYLRGHIVGELFAGAFDVWLGTGFHPFSRVWVATQDLPNYQVNALALPFELGATLFGSSSFGLELKLSLLQWMPLEYCVDSNRNLVCGASMQSQTSWDASLGFTWVL